jgi:L,D-peptidoglycan transpeptidase YkuD (ErfK/YbiS/YcfS/YnhG family)
MTIFLKNKHTLQVDDFYFKCCVGKNGISKQKKEGDKKTPKGIFLLDYL